MTNSAERQRYRPPYAPHSQGTGQADSAPYTAPAPPPATTRTGGTPDTRTSLPYGKDATDNGKASPQADRDGWPTSCPPYSPCSGGSAMTDRTDVRTALRGCIRTAPRTSRPYVPHIRAVHVDRSIDATDQLSIDR
jgi:hypothetical protein